MKYLFIFIFSLLSIRGAHSLELKDLRAEASSPLTTNAKYVVYTGTALTLALVAFKSGIVDPFQKSQSTSKPLGSSSHYGDLFGQLIPNLAYAGGAAMLSRGDRAMGMLKATAYSSALITAMKYTIQEKRPDGSERNSFPSGHTTTAFAFAGYVAKEHGWKWGAPAMAMAGFTGFSRINDNRHYLHDVVAGATIGLAYGWGMSEYLSRKKAPTPQPPTADPKKTPEPPKDEGPFIVPIIDRDLAGVGIQGEF